MSNPSPQYSQLVESIHKALLVARESRQLIAPLTAVKVSINPSGSVIVHLLPMGDFGPYLRKQIPHDVVADVKRFVELSASQRRTRSVPATAVPAQLSLAQLLHYGAGSSNVQ